MSIQVSTRKGPRHSINQDSHSILHNGKVKSLIICDGHGDHGEVVSKAIVSKLPAEILSSMISAETDSKDIENIVSDTIIDLDKWAEVHLKHTTDSGCTVAGVLHDTRDHSLIMYGVGDSMIFIREPNGSVHAMPPQNASNVPSFIQKELSSTASKYDIKMNKLINKSTGYMLFPDDPGSGLQLWSSIGDFDLKYVNPVVGVYPYVRKIEDIAKGTQIIISSDGYTDGLDHKPLSEKWFTSIYKEVLKSKGNPMKLIEMARSRGSSDDITVITYTV